MEANRKCLLNWLKGFSKLPWPGCRFPTTAGGRSISFTAPGSLPTRVRVCFAFCAHSMGTWSWKAKGERSFAFGPYLKPGLLPTCWKSEKERLVPKIAFLEWSFSQTGTVEPCIPDHRLTAQHRSHPMVSCIHLWHWEIHFNTCSPTSYMEIIQPFSTKKNEAWGLIKNLDYFNPLKSSRREGIYKTFFKL